MLAAPFIVGAANVLKSPKVAAERSADISMPIAEAVGLPKDPELLVKINAGVQIAGGLMLATGRLPRVAALALGASIIPTTLAGHRFWEQKEEPAKTQQLLHFVKNAGLLGGLLSVALDTGGRPSVLWSSRKAIAHAAHAVAETVGDAASSAGDLLPGH
jgi:uncharacterized membrane protein YphA (DoxX/SURF4 family)